MSSVSFSIGSVFLFNQPIEDETEDGVSLPHRSSAVFLTVNSGLFVPILHLLINWDKESRGDSKNLSL